MKTSKQSVVVLVALALVLSLTASAWARPQGCGPGAMNLSPEQAGKFFDLKEKFRNDTAEVRKQMAVKRAELAALWKAEKPDEKAIVAKQKELNALRGQMMEKSVAFRLEARKIAPELARTFAHGHGMGRGDGPMSGPGGGKGPGGSPGPGGPAK